MMAEIKAKAKKGGGKKAPSFEVLDVTENERERGEKVAAYQAKKEAQQNAAAIAAQAEEERKQAERRRAEQLIQEEDRRQREILEQ